MKQRYDNYIGLDPGTITGVAIWDAKNKRLERVFSGGILHVMDKLELMTIFGNNLFIIENPNLRKWYGKNSKGKEQGAGSIKRDYKIWLEWFDKMNANYQEVNPKNVNTKINSKSFKNMTGWEERTNSHSRDAAMMVWGK